LGFISHHVGSDARCGWRIANTIRNHKQLAGLITVVISPTLTPIRDLLTLFLHFVVTVTRLVGPGGAGAVVADSLLMRQQLLVLSRTRCQAPPLSATDRVLFGLWALFLSP
jgi:hypothetical protein